MTKFRNYFSAFDEVKSVSKQFPSEVFATMGFDPTDVESVYAFEIKKIGGRSPIAVVRLKSELLWYRSKRPYFNVYPLIEQKFMELSEDIDMAELVMPFPTIEVRTQTKTILICDRGKFFLIVIEREDDTYQELLVQRTHTVKKLFNQPRLDVDEFWPEVKGDRVSEGYANQCVLLAVGTCMLAKDPNIIMPVILNCHQKESMTPAEVAEYAEKAINRTGRVGFDVGKKIERMKATVHYRNGCFAKYYVGKDHESYPQNAVASKVPVIKWRSGAIVNKDNVPKVPTGFKDHPVPSTT
jgi:hypothetical protein